MYEDPEEKTMLAGDATTGGFFSKPLRPGSSRETISQNIREMTRRRKPKTPAERRQIVAAAMSNARRTGRGKVPPKPKN